MAAFVAIPRWWLFTVQWGPVEVLLAALVAVVVPVLLAASCGLPLASLAHWKASGIPHDPVGWPYLGSVADAALGRKPIGQVYADIYNRWRGKRYVGFCKFARPAILLRDPQLVRKVIVTDFHHFPANEVEADVDMDPMFGRHLFALSGEPWSRLRRCLAEGFTGEKLREVFALLPEVSEALRVHSERQTERAAGGRWAVELRRLCVDFTTSAMSTVALGVPCDAIDHPETELRRMVHLLLEPTMKKILSHLVFLHVPRLARALGIRFVPREVAEFFRRSVRGEVWRREEGGVQRGDYMQMFVGMWREGRLRQEGGGKPSARGQQREEGSRANGGHNTKNQQNDELDDITAVAMAFVSDGTVTTSSLLSFTFFELAHHPEVQNKVRREVKSVVERHGGVVTFEGLQEMPYLDMVLLEVLRLYPPAPFIVRSCAKSYQLPNPVGNTEQGGLLLEKGMPIVVPVYGIQRDDEYYPNAEEFDPNRFSMEAIKGRKHFTYYPYGEGPRICIGIRFGLLLAKSAIAHTLPSIEFLPHDNTSRPITLDPHYFITVSKGGLWVQTKKID